MKIKRESTRAIGNFGEDFAIKYLVDKGFEIKKRNFHFGKVGEIDIIAEKDGFLVFVEVKYRTNKNYGDPLESINPRKISSLRRTADGYLYVNKIYNKECRFDIIAIDATSQPPVINHLVNAIF